MTQPEFLRHENELFPGRSSALKNKMYLRDPPHGTCIFVRIFLGIRADFTAQIRVWRQILADGEGEGGHAGTKCRAVKNTLMK
jgi:hypothetical protein